MRALPDLTPLDEQPAVWQQSTDDWNGIFANELAGIDSQQAAADQGSGDTNAAMAGISSDIDALSGALDAAGDVLDILSGDLDTVNLDPQIMNFQGADTALDNNLSNPVFDFTEAANFFFSFFETIVTLIYQVASHVIQIIGQQLEQAIANLMSQIAGMILNA